MVFNRTRSTRIILRINADKLLRLIINLLIDLILVIKNFFLLIFLPYKTIRKVCLKKDYYQIGFIFLLVFVYFKFIYYLRDKPYPASLIFIIFLINFFLTSGFFYWLSWLFNKKIKYSSFLSTLSYSLIPTLIWFLATSVFYILLPPPRTLSFLGKGFSIFFITFSLSLLVWKLILFYLSLRFSSKLGFYRIMYMIFLYLVWFLPYSILLYYLRLFRVPFI